MAGLRKPGRPSKGPRRRYDLWLPEHLAERLEEDAESTGQTFTGWLEEAVAGRLEGTHQEHRPLAKAS